MNNSIIFISIVITILAGLVVFSKNPIHSILALVLLFFYISILFLFLKIEFVAIIMLIIYVGALTVLFLFVVMMLNIRVIELEKNMATYFPFFIIILCLFFFQLYYIFDFKISNHILNFYDSSSVLSNISIGGNRSLYVFSTNFHKNFFKQKILEDDLYSIYNFINIYTEKKVNLTTLQTRSRLYDGTIKYQSKSPLFFKKNEIDMSYLYFTNRYSPKQFVFIPYRSYFDNVFNLNKDVIQTFGTVLYSYYSPYFIVLGFILLLAMVGSISLVLETKQKIILKEIIKKNN